MTKPTDTLEEVHRLRRRTRSRTHGGAWLPALAIAMVVLGSIALYAHPFASPSEIRGDRPAWAGLNDQQRNPAASYVYWFLGVPAALAVTALWYRWRERRLGLRVAWRGFIVVALVVLGLLAVVVAAPAWPQGDELARVPPLRQLWYGVLTPLLPVAVAVVALGRAERSRWLVGSGAWLGLMAVAQCATLWSVHTGVRPGPLLIVLALPLLGFAVVRPSRARR